MAKLISFQSKTNGLTFLKKKINQLGFFLYEDNDSIIIFFLVAAIIFNNKEDIDKGFCHLQKVKIQVFLDCILSYTAAVTIALAKNESDTSGNYILQCVWIDEKSMNCSGDGDERGNYNSSTEILEIELIFKDNKHAGLYLRITTYCNSGSIALTPCREFLLILCLLRFGFRTFIYLY